jgi:hypothetical protein
MPLPDLSLLTKIQRNHGFEHATVHVLTRRLGKLSIVGRSDWNGFTLYGPVDTDDVRVAVEEALQRLRQGEAELAVHPRCGTGIAVTGFLTALAAFLAIGLDSGDSTKRFRWGAIPAAILAATGAVILAQPLGLWLQEEYTTSGDPGNLEIKSITLQPNARFIVHRIETTQ